MKKQIDVLALLTTLLPMVCVLLLISAISGCATRVGSGIEQACGTWDYIYASRYDTLATVDQIFMNNIKREAFCDGK